MKKLYTTIALATMALLGFTACSSTDAPEYATSERLEMDLSQDIGASETSKSVSVTADCHWNATISSSDADWIQISKGTSGDNSGSIELMIDENTSITRRQATLTVTSRGGLTRNVTIRQAPSGVTLALSNNTNDLPLNFQYTAMTSSFTVNCNTTWSVSGVPDWMTISPSSGDGTANRVIAVDVTVPTLRSDIERTAVLTVTAGELTEQLLVRQTGMDVQLTASQVAFDIETTGQSITLPFNSNADWYVSTDAQWAELLGDTQGENENLQARSYTASVRCAANTTLSQRTATITVQAGSKSLPIVLTQPAATLPVLSRLQLSIDSIDGVTDAKHMASARAHYESMYQISECGFIYGTSADRYAATGSVTLNGNSTGGDLNMLLTDLESAVTYYVWAYATSAVGTGYSESPVTVTTAGTVPSSGDNTVPSPARRK